MFYLSNLHSSNDIGKQVHLNFKRKSLVCSTSYSRITLTEELRGDFAASNIHRLHKININRFDRKSAIEHRDLNEIAEKFE